MPQKMDIGASLMQEGHTFEYASRSLNKSEQNYAQTEKEMLTIVFGHVQKWHQYIYGRTKVVETNHGPLENLFRKPLAMVPPELNT